MPITTALDLIFFFYYLYLNINSSLPTPALFWRALIKIIYIDQTSKDQEST